MRKSARNFVAATEKALSCGVEDSAEKSRVWRLQGGWQKRKRESHWWGSNPQPLGSKPNALPLRHNGYYWNITLHTYQCIW
jgi:hypothetical protein